MVTPSELLRVILAPVIVSAVIAAIGRWRGWAWAMPIAVGAGFLAGYALLGLPKLPPRDGTDWLFWVAIPVTLLGAFDSILGGRWGWVLGALAGAVTCVIAWPLVPHAVVPNALYITAAGIAAQSVLVCFVAWYVQGRVPPGAIVAALCLTLGAAAVVVMSSNLRIVGVYGIAAAAALGPVAMLIGKAGEARGVAVVAVCLLAGLLAGGIYYPEPPVSGLNVAVLSGAPLLIILGYVVPGKRPWLRGAVAVLGVGATVASVMVPTALEAKRASESESASDPYAGYP